MILPRVPLLALPLLALLGCAAVDGRSHGDAERGRRTAEAWCSECHRIAPDQPSGARPGHILPPPVAAPSFMSIAARPYADTTYLQQFMGELHLPMPTFRLSPAERDDVIAYLLSLRDSGAR